MSLDPCPSDEELLRMAAERSARRRRAPEKPLASVSAPPPPLARSAEQDRSISEAKVQKAVVDYLRRLGFQVWRIGQRNAKGTQDPGVPDLYAAHRGYGGVLWVECKSPVGGRQSREQQNFEAVCQATGQRYILAKSVDDVRVTLLAHFEARQRETTEIKP